MSRAELVEELRWIFRDQPKEDYGIDAHIEVVDDGVVTGRLIGLQVKCGSSFFREPAAEGWWFRPNSAHVNYWLGHSLPVVVILCDPQDKNCYWGLLDRDALVRTSTGNRKFLVPRANLLNGSAEKALRSIAFAPSYQPPSGGDQIRRETATQLNPPEAMHIREDPDPFFAAMRRRAQRPIRVILMRRPSLPTAVDCGGMRRSAPGKPTLQQTGHISYRSECRRRVPRMSPPLKMSNYNVAPSQYQTMSVCRGILEAKPR